MEPSLISRRRCAAALSALVAWPAAARKATPGPQPPVVIHHIGPLSGNGGGAGPNREFLSGAQLAFWQSNEGEGIAGRPIELELLDDAQDAQKTAQLFRDAAVGGEMLALFMPRTSPSIRAAIAISEETGVPVIAPQTGGSFITEPPKRTVFAVRASYRSEIAAAMQHFHTVGVRRFAMLNEEGPFGDDVKAGFEQAIAALRLGPAGVFTIANTAIDVSPAVFEASMRATPEVVFLCISSEAAAHYIRTARKQGRPSQFVSLSNTSTAGFLQGLGAEGRGVMMMQVVPPPLASKFGISKEFVAAATSSGSSVSHGALQGYISARVLIAGLRRAAPQISAASLVSALGSIDRLDLGGYVVSYANGKRAGSSFVNPTMISGEGRFLY